MGVTAGVDVDVVDAEADGVDTDGVDVAGVDADDEDAASPSAKATVPPFTSKSADKTISTHLDTTFTNLPCNDISKPLNLRLA